MMTPLLGVGRSVPCPVHAYVSPCVPEPRARARPSGGLARTVPVPVCGSLGSSSSFSQPRGRSSGREQGGASPHSPLLAPGHREGSQTSPDFRAIHQQVGLRVRLLATPPCASVGTLWLLTEEAIAVSEQNGTQNH